MVVQRRGHDAIHPLRNVEINWDDVMKPEPEGRGYGYQAKFVPSGAAVNMYSAAGVECGIHYLGVDAHGRNRGVRAILNTVRRDRRGPDGGAAQGGYPYFKQPNNPPQGLHRGHLVAKSLGGSGSRINWVPLKYSQNLEMFRLLESIILNHIREERGNWAEIAVALRYDFYIPVPTRIIYDYRLHSGGGASAEGEGQGEDQVVQGQRVISNHLERDQHAISFGLRHRWSGNQ